MAHLRARKMSYNYGPLQSVHHIRLLRLDPGEREDPLTGSISQLSLNSANSCYFEALSYVWGNPTTSFDLHTPEGVLKITASLHSALKRLRDKQTPYLIWADAICINQSDFTEKSHQVRLMPRIYGAASCTVVHLGGSTEDGRVAIKALNKIAEGKGMDDLVVSAKVYHEDNNRIQVDSPMPIHEEEEAWKAIAKLLCQPWFRRAWVIQEFVLAKEVIMLWGEEHFDWMTLSKVLDEPDRLVRLMGPSTHYHMAKPIPDGQTTELLSPSADLLDHITELSLLRKRHWRGHKLAILYLLSRCATARSTLMRDQLFARLGMASDANHSSLDPDYKGKLSDIVYRYAVHFIKRGNVEILYEAGLEPSEDRFASWIPDWTQHSYRKGVMGFAGTWKHSFKNNDISFKATYSAGGDGKPSVHYNSTDKCLVMEGVMIDQLDEVSGGPSPFDSNSEHPEEFSFRTINEAILTTNKMTTYPTGEDVGEVFWRTLIANRTVQEQLPPPSFGDTIFTMLDAGRRQRDSTPADVQEISDAFKVWNKRFTLTSTGYVGLVPLQAKPGDFVFIAPGCAVPFIVRHGFERPGFFRLVGSCYIHGFMDGEGLNGKWQQKTIKVY